MSLAASSQAGGRKSGRGGDHRSGPGGGGASDREPDPAGPDSPGDKEPRIPGGPAPPAGCPTAIQDGRWPDPGDQWASGSTQGKQRASYSRSRSPCEAIFKSFLHFACIIMIFLGIYKLRGSVAPAGCPTAIQDGSWPAPGDLVIRWVHSRWAKCIQV